MQIRFISTLTADDETRFAPAVLAILGRLLDEFSIPYTLRIETSDPKVFQRCHSALEIASGRPGRTSRLTGNADDGGLGQPACALGE